MTSGQIFRHNSRLHSRLGTRLHSRLNSHSISSLSEKDVATACWLLRALPDFGIVQLDGRRVDPVVEQFELLIDIPLVRWNPTEQFAGYAELLADKLTFASADYVYLQHSLRVWAEKGGVLWILVDADLIPNEQLMQLLHYRPLSRSGQYSIRILLKVSDDRLHDKSLAPLADVIHERVSDPVSVKPSKFNYARFKVCAPYLFILFLSAASITATVYVASQEKSAVAKAQDSGTEPQNIVFQNIGPQNIELQNIVPQNIEPQDKDPRDIKASDEVLQPAMPGNRSVESLLPVQAQPEMITPDSEVGSVLQSGKSEVLSLIERWSRAWQQQSVDEYFLMYGDDYSPDKHMSSKEWRLWRTARLNKPAWISIEIGPVAIEYAAEGELHATFWQLYRSPGYQDDTLKTLILSQEAGIWKITDEINVEVRPLSQ